MQEWRTPRVTLKSVTLGMGIPVWQQTHPRELIGSGEKIPREIGH